MPSRAPALHQEIHKPLAVTEALKKGLRPLILFGVFLGVATFAGLSVLAPGHFSNFAEMSELAVVVAIVGILTGLAAIAVASLLRNRAAVGRSKSSGGKQTMSESTSPKKEPLIREMSEAEAAACETTGSEILQPAAEGRSLSEALNAPQREAANVPSFSDMDALCAHLKSRRSSGGGHRVLMTGASEAVSPFAEAVELAKDLAETRAQTILIDWSPRGEGLARAMDLGAPNGWNALMSGEARFDTIIQRLPGTRAHFIASGNALHDGEVALDADLLNTALDALDEVYDYIVVSARHDEARMLFECIEGRFDTGIAIVADDATDGGHGDATTFLGFEVADIDILRFHRSKKAAAASPAAERIARATRAREPVARHA